MKKIHALIWLLTVIGIGLTGCKKDKDSNISPPTDGLWVSGTKPVYRTHLTLAAKNKLAKKKVAFRRRHIYSPIVMEPASLVQMYMAAVMI